MSCICLDQDLDLNFCEDIKSIGNDRNLTTFFGDNSIGILVQKCIVKCEMLRAHLPLKVTQTYHPPSSCLTSHNLQIDSETLRQIASIPIELTSIEQFRTATTLTVRNEQFLVSLLTREDERMFETMRRMESSFRFYFRIQPSCTK